MISNKDIKDFWENKFIKYSEKELQKFNLLEETVSFLVEVGLPNEEILKQNGVYHTFYESNDFKEVLIDGEKYTIIGKFADVDIYIYINCESEEVFTTKKSNLVYINSSIRNFLIFEQICRSEFYKVKAYEEDEMSAAVERMKEKFMKIEPNALVEDSYWDQYLFPYEIGFL
ncbi:SUKH-4 family immunity protein [Paenibacillus melissococcoides]|uniref:SUKH-4 family immunity protein n=1 Tax=Paenibacillus melissococcoides TaxID=2912268 RepID=A0ABN8U0H5_9BACL|nr:SUKH-4 family immunity protein [Paenibacillus melissococcoides]MEB9895682.1 SUKH-4 family immunity protein [Bacillus cereus]CAH8244569.1 SUKH-4 family immunity protein [Paenibacillus melissococcoides]CAH8708372.1 SUKH-4 family immunity protein [Paenibacillus melissococcoides]CAH8709080.1 SUKH-4 family immunity protein [Paenibacillus melissococcoides]